MNKQRWMSGGIVGVVAAISLSAVLMGANSSPEATPKATVPPQPVPPKYLFERSEPEHWSEMYIKALTAERTPEQSIYLSAVQLVEMERKHHTGYKAIPYLEEIAQKATSQQLRSALHRLIADIYNEEGDEKNAEKELKTIIDQNLVQM